MRPATPVLQPGPPLHREPLCATAFTTSSNLHGLAVALERSVRGQQHEALLHRLRDEQTVERVAVNPRQCGNAEQVLGADTELRQLLVQQTLAQLTNVDEKVRPSGLPSEVLNATSQSETRLNAAGVARSARSLDARAESLGGSNASHRTSWVSSRTTTTVSARREHALDISLEGLLQVGLDLAVASHEPELALRTRRVDRHDSDHRLAGLGNDESPALGRLVDEPRQMCLGYVDVDGRRYTCGLSHFD